MIIYGWRSTAVAAGPIHTACPQCSTRGRMAMHIMQRYVHIFWIPLVPIGKTGATHCDNCKSVLRQKNFTPDIAMEYTTLKQQAKTPIWNFAGLGIIGALVLFGLISANREDAANGEMVAAPKVGDIYEVKSGEKEYTLLKVTAIQGDSVYMCQNEYACDTATGFDDLMMKPFSSESYGYARSELKEMLTKETIMDVRRQ